MLSVSSSERKSPASGHLLSYPPWLSSHKPKIRGAESKQLGPDAPVPSKQVVTPRKTGGKMTQKTGIYITAITPALNSPAVIMLVLDLEGGVPSNRVVYKQAS